MHAKRSSPSRRPRHRPVALCPRRWRLRAPHRRTAATRCIEGMRMTRQPPTPHVIARSAPLRLTGLAALVLVLTGCASLSPDGGFGEVEKATAERIGAP